MKFICHICHKEIDEYQSIVSGMCDDCIRLIHTDKYEIGVCPVHNTPQILIRRVTDGKLPKYTFMTRCMLEEEIKKKKE